MDHAFASAIFAKCAIAHVQKWPQLRLSIGQNEVLRAWFRAEPDFLPIWPHFEPCWPLLMRMHRNGHNMFSV